MQSPRTRQVVPPTLPCGLDERGASTQGLDAKGKKCRRRDVNCAGHQGPINTVFTRRTILELCEDRYLSRSHPPRQEGNWHIPRCPPAYAKNGWHDTYRLYFYIVTTIPTTTSLSLPGAL